MVMAAWCSDKGGVVGSCIGVHIVTVIVVDTQVRMTMVEIRVPPRMGVAVVIGGEFVDGWRDMGSLTPCWSHGSRPTDRCQG